MRLIDADAFDDVLIDGELKARKARKMSRFDPDTYCRDCKRSIHGEYADCDINIENNGRYVKGDHPCYCKIGPDGKMAEKYPWELRTEGR